MKALYKLSTVIALTLSLSSGALAVPSAVCTAKSDRTEFADFGKTAMPLVALGVSLLKEDWYGAIFSEVWVNALYPLNNKFEHKIGKKRPCGCSGAFPSGHMIVYAASSSYLHYRYGWEYGVPAYIATIAFAADRVNNKAHSWGDMLGTFAIINIMTYFVTPQYTKEGVIFIDASPEVQANIKYLEYAEQKQPAIMPSVIADRKKFMAGIAMKI